jgi:hypothetical protein
MTAVNASTIDLSSLFSRPQALQANPPVVCDDCHSGSHASKSITRVLVAELSQRLKISMGAGGAGGIEELAGALRNALGRAAASGDDGVASSLKSINQALDSAVASLRKAGVSDQAIAGALAEVRQSLAGALSGKAEQTAFESLSYSRRDKASLKIETQEGDRVQIRFKSREGAVAQSSVSATGSEQFVYAFSKGRVQVAVDGELNAEELKAISDLVAKVESLAADFFAGDVQGAFEAAAALGFDGSQIASFALKLSTKESFAQERRGAAVTTAPALEAAPKKPKAAAPAASAVKPAPRPTETAPSPNITPADASATTPALPADVAGPISQFLRSLFENLGQNTSAGSLRFSMSWQVRVVVAAVEAQTPRAEGTPGTRLLNEAATSLASQQDGTVANAA